MSIKKSLATAAVFTAADQYYWKRGYDLQRSAQSAVSEYLTPSAIRMGHSFIPSGMGPDIVMPVVSGALYVLSQKVMANDANSWMLQFFQQAGSSKGADVLLPMLPASLNA